MEQQQDNLLKVKFNSQLNTVIMKDFFSSELDIFYTLISKAKEQGSKDITLNYDELKKLTGYNKNITSKDYTKTLERFYSKLIALTFRFEDEDVIEKFVLFDKYKIKKSDNTITIRTSETFKFLLNKLDEINKFTQFELREFVKMKSRYSKMLYRIIKQYRKSTWKTMSVDELKMALDIPESYNAGNITQKVIKPIENELPNYIKGFKVIPIKGKGKDKRKIVSYRFEFEKDSISTWDPNKYNTSNNNKKSKLKTLAKEDNRMTKQDRLDYVNRKMNQRLPIETHEEFEEIKNVEGQIDLEDL